MSNDKREDRTSENEGYRNARWDKDVMSFGDGTPLDPTATQDWIVGNPDLFRGDVLRGSEFLGLGSSRYNGDNLYYDGKGFHGQLDGQLIDGFLSPVHIFKDQRELHDAVFQADSGAVFHCGNNALVAQGQHLAGVWQKSGIEFKLVPEAWRIPEPPTYADIRKD